MSRINTNVNSLIATRVLNTNNNTLNKNLERLSTGLRINRGADDPAGLIASEALRADKTALAAAIGNAERANSMIATAEGALNEISTMLTKLQDLVGEAANKGGLTQEEIDANQVQVDGIIGTINRIASQTSFAGKKLLDGSQDFNITATATNTTDVVINSAKVGSSDVTATVAVTTAATRAAAAAGIKQTLTADLTVEIAGAKGSQAFTFSTGATAAQMVSAINAAKDATGVSAVANAGAVDIGSIEYGADQFVSVKLVSGAAADVTTGVSKGGDAVVNINGMKAAVDGYKVSLRNSNLNMDLVMTSAFAGAVGTSDVVIKTGGGGMTFSLSPNIGIGGREVIGIGSMGAHSLGTAALGHLSDITTGQSKNLTDKAEDAQKIVAASIKQVASLRGKLGSFQNDTLGSTINSLNVALENVSAAESAIRDSDFATETSSMTRTQILVNAATSVLAMANSAPQAVLGLLR